MTLRYYVCHDIRILLKYFSSLVLRRGYLRNNILRVLMLPLVTEVIICGLHATWSSKQASHALNLKEILETPITQQ